MTNMRKLLLLVEDEAIIALARYKELEKNGFLVESVRSGEAAIERVKEDPPIDLILMDIDLGRDRMDGTEAARTILSDRSVPIVFLTSHSERSMVERVKGISRYGYVLKNAGQFVLQETIHMAFEIWNHQQERERAITQMRATNARFLSIANGGAFGFYSGERDSIEFVNDTLLDVLGYRRDEIVGRAMYEFLVPADRESDAGRYEAAVRSEATSYKSEVHFRTRSGGTICAELTVVIVFDDEGRVMELVGIVDDVTEERSLDRRYRELFLRGNDAIYLIGYDGYVIDVNEAACRSTQRPRSELVGISIDKIDANFSIEAFQSFWNVAIDTAQIFETVHIKRDGTRFPVEVSGSIFRLGDQTVLYGIARDLTERRKADELYQILLQQATYGSGYYTIDGTIRFYNNIALGYLGKTNDEVVGRHITELFPKEQSDVYLTRIAECLSQDEPKAYEDHVDLPTGEYWFVTTYSKVYAADGSVSGIHMISADTTERKRVELSLRQREWQMRQAQSMAGVGNWEWNVQTGEIYTSEQVNEIIFGDPSNPFKDIETFLEVILPEDRDATAGDIQRMITQPGENESHTRVVRQTDNSIRHLRTRSYLSVDGEGKPYILSGILVDETEQVNALQEKDLLIREGHHRVHNNMLSAIASLRLQASHHDDDRCVGVLESAAQRLRVMLALYDSLYTTKRTDSTDVSVVFSDLLSKVREIYREDDGIAITHDIAHLPAPPSTVTNIGVILNEAITNAVKHTAAWKHTTPGGHITIDVRLYKEGTDGVLVVSDDGPGFTPSEFEEDGFGHVLMRTLTEQISGTFEIDGTHGTTVSVRFPIPDTPLSQRRLSGIASDDA